MKVIIKNVRLRFHDLWEQKSVMGGAPKYGATFIIEPGSENHKKLEEAIKECAIQQWKSKASEVLESIRPIPNKFPLRSGSEKPNTSGYEGKFFFSAKNPSPIVVYDRDMSKVTKETGRIYAGCYVNASLDIYPFTRYGNQIVANLMQLQFAKDGEAFTPGAVADPGDFEDLSEGALAEEFA